MSEAVGLSDARRILLEKYLRQKVQTVSAEPEPIPRRPPGLPIPLSYWQQLLWLHSQMVSDVPVYNEPITVHRIGPLDVPTLERSLTEIFRRHEAWRTTFTVVDGQPVQIIQPPPTITLPVTDLRSLPQSERVPEALRLAAQDARIRIDLRKGPLLRFRLVRLSDEEHRLFVILHHFVFDGWSIYSVFLRELIALYESFLNGQPSPLAELPVQYADFAYWQRETLQREQFSDQVSYWRRQLRDLPVLELPSDRPRPAVESHRGSMHPVALPEGLCAALRDLSQRQGVTFFMTLLAGFETLLHRYTGQEDMVMGTVTAGRNRPELEKMLGLFLNPLVLRTDLSGNPAFSELLLRIRDVTLAALAHSDVPFHYVVEELQPKRDPSYNPLFQAMIAREPPLTGLTPGWNMTQADIDNGGSKMDLYLDLDDRPSGIIGRFTYNTDIFDRPTITRLLRHWQSVLEAAVADPSRRLSQLPILTDAERRQMCSLCKTVPPTRRFVPFTREETKQSIPSRFESIAANYGNRIAINIGSAGILPAVSQVLAKAGGTPALPRGDWSYAALNKFSNRIARTLLNRLGTGQHRIALFFGHGAPMIASMLGVLKAGKTYVPIDPLYPAERISYILQDSEATVLLTDGANRAAAESLAANAIPIISVDEIEAGVSDQNPGTVISPETVAYILYTSGSTGRPKGVMQSHGNVLTFIKNYTNAFQVSCEDRLSLIPSYGFDAAVIDIYGGLMNGACLCPFDVREESITKLGAWLSTQRVSIYHSTPTVYRHFMDALDGTRQLPNVRLVILGGEPVQKRDFELFQAHLSPECLFANLSGQTESSLNMINILDSRAIVTGSSVSMGRPVDDTEVLLLDQAGQVTEVYGEIGIRSEHIALGYWNQPELTRTVFVGDPDGGKGRLYRSGDMARMMPDGSLEFVQRKDSQVKLHGFRIELGEIETVLSQHPSVKEAAAAICETGNREKQIVAYWVPNQNAEPIEQLAKFADVPKMNVRKGTASAVPQTVQPSSALAAEVKGTSGAKAHTIGLSSGTAEAVPLLLGQVNFASSSTAGELREFVKKKLPNYMIPSLFVRLDALPLTTSGKLNRRALPAPEQERHRDDNVFVAPRNDLEKQLAEIWETVLEIKPIGIEDDFFALGGHSLLAVRLFDAIENTFGQRLSLSTLFQAPTVAQMAQLLREEKDLSTASSLVPIQTSGTLPPLFCVHGHFGEILFYRPLSQCLGAEQPFYALQAQAREGAPAHDTIAGMAAEYLSEIRRIHSGPYYIAGYCLGAVVAFEMAQQLLAEGEEVAFLGMFIGYPPKLNFLERLQVRMKRHLGQLRHMGPRAKLALFRSNLAGKMHSLLWRVTYQMFRHKLPRSSRLFQNVPEMNLQAAKRYTPKTYPREMTVFLSENIPPGFRLDPKSDLDGMDAQKIHLRIVPGDRDSMLHEPHVSVLAEELRKCLSAARHETNTAPFEA